MSVAPAARVTLKARVVRAAAAAALRRVAIGTVRFVGIDLADIRTLVQVAVRGGVLIFYAACAGLAIRAFIWGTGLLGLFGGG